MEGKGRPKDEIYKYEGVTEEANGKWSAQISGRNYISWLGIFDSAYEATLAYNRAARAIYGQSARLIIIPEVTNGSSSTAATVSSSVTTFTDESEVCARKDTDVRSEFCQVTLEDGSGARKKSGKTRTARNVAETLRKWREKNKQIEASSCNDGSPSKPIQRGISRNTNKGYGKSNYKGVYQRYYGRWASQINLPGQRSKLWLGSFKTAEDAALAYDRASIDMYGKLAQLNFPEMMNGSSSAAATVSASATTFSDESEVCAREDTHLRSGFCQVTLEDDTNEYTPFDNSQSINDEPEVRELNSANAFGNGQDPEEENLASWLWLIGIGNEHVPIDFDTNEVMAMALLDDGNMSAPGPVHGLVDSQPNFSNEMQLPDANLFGSHNPMETHPEDTQPLEIQTNRVELDRLRFHDHDIHDLDFAGGKKDTHDRT